MKREVKGRRKKGKNKHRKKKKLFNWLLQPKFFSVCKHFCGNSIYTS